MKRVIEWMDDAGMVDMLPAGPTSLDHGVNGPGTVAGPLDASVLMAPVVAGRYEKGVVNTKGDMIWMTAWTQYGLIGLHCTKGQAAMIPLADAEIRIDSNTRNSVVYRDDHQLQAARETLAALTQPPADLPYAVVRYENKGRTFAGRLGYDSDYMWLRFDDGTLWKQIPWLPFCEPGVSTPKAQFDTKMESVMDVIRSSDRMWLPYNTFNMNNSASVECRDLTARLDREEDHEYLLRPLTDGLMPLLAPEGSDCPLAVWLFGDPAAEEAHGKFKLSTLVTSFSKFKNGNWKTRNLAASGDRCRFIQMMPYDPALYHDSCEKALKRVEIWRKGMTDDDKQKTREELEKWKFIERL